jgi:hypothetical protein
MQKECVKCNLPWLYKRILLPSGKSGRQSLPLYRQMAVLEIAVSEDVLSDQDAILATWVYLLGSTYNSCMHFSDRVL